MTMFRQIQVQAKLLLSGSSATKHVLAVSGSALAAQVIGVISGPINTRLYSPTDFGTLALFAAAFSIFSELATMRYDMALPIVEDEREGIHLLLLCMLIGCAWTLLATMLVVVAGQPIARWLAPDNAQLTKYLWFLPLGFLATSLFTILSSWAVRKRAFGDLSIARITQSLLGSACTVGMGFLRAGSLGLLTGTIFATAGGTWRLFSTAAADVRRDISEVRFADLIQVARRHYRYPAYTTWSAVMIAISSHVPIIFLTRGFDSHFAGYFSLCNRVLTLPATVVGSAITPVFFSRIKQAQEEGNLQALTLRVLDGIVGINVFFMVFLALFGEQFFTLVFGAQWHRSGQYAAALGPWLLCSFLSTPFSTLPLLFDKQAKVLAFQGTLLVLRVLAMLAGIALGNDLIAMWLFSGISAIYLLIYLGWMLTLVKVPLTGPLKLLGKELVLAFALLGGCRLILWLSHGNTFLTGLALVPVLTFAAIRSIRRILQHRSTPSAPEPS